ncbi:transposable element Tcb2 transposase [Trichonephila clavipes]|nr:transposable element Tcb2 transposase [Trichonephila clavipes]
MWFMVAQRLTLITSPAATPDQLWQRVEATWSAVPQERIKILFGSMPRQAWRVVGRLEGGQTQAEVAQAIGVSQSVISRIWNRFLETGSAGRRPGQGRRRATKPNEDRYLVLSTRRHRHMNATLLQQHLRSAIGTMVSTQTVRNWLHGVGLYARRPMVCVRLTSRHHRDRREWATEHENWRRNEWSNVLFSDESRFSVHPGNRRIFIWRDCCSRNNPAFVHESVIFGGGGVLVYGGISIDGCTDLYIIRDGPLTARRYSDEILRPIVVPSAAAIGDDFILMDDNCMPHRANLVEDRTNGMNVRMNRTNGMACVFSRHESIRARLGRSRKTSCWPPTTPTNSPRTGKSSSGRVGQNTPTRD